MEILKYRIFRAVSDHYSATHLGASYGEQVWNSTLITLPLLISFDWQTSKHQLVIILVRDLVLTSLGYNTLFHARHIPGVHNSGADYLSHFQVERSRKFYPKQTSC